MGVCEAKRRTGRVRRGKLLVDERSQRRCNDHATRVELSRAGEERLYLKPQHPRAAQCESERKSARPKDRENCGGTFGDDEKQTKEKRAHQSQHLRVRKKTPSHTPHRCSYEVRWWKVRYCMAERYNEHYLQNGGCMWTRGTYE